MSKQTTIGAILESLKEAHWGLLPALLALAMLASGAADLSLNGFTFVLFAALAASYDLAARRIPNQLNLIAAVCGLALALTTGGWSGAGRSLLAILVCLVPMTVLFFMGAMGGGDVKAMAALAAFLAPFSALQFLALTFMAGGALALVRLLAARGVLAVAGPGQVATSAGKLSLPYGLAIAAGAALVNLLGGVA